MSARFRKFLPLHILMMGTVLLIALYVQNSDHPYRLQIQNILFDNLNKTHLRPASDQVVIVDIDEKSLDRPELGQWPWPRTTVAELITKIAKDYQAKVIGFDMVFAEADNTSPDQLVRIWRKQGGDEAVFNALDRLESHDKIMARAIRDAGNVVLGLNFEDQRSASAFGYTPRPKADVSFAHQAKDDLLPYIYPFDTVANYPILSRFSYGEGHFYAVPDTDGLYRAIPMVMGIEKKNIRVDAAAHDRFFFYPSLTAEMLRYLTAQNQISLDDVQNRNMHIKGGDYNFELPLSADGQFYVWYARPNPDWYLSAYDVLRGEIPLESLKDKIVLIGTSAIGLKDIRSTPVGNNRPGVEVHLNIIDQALQGQFLKRPDNVLHAEQMLLLGLCMLMIGLSARLALSGQTILMLGCVTLCFAVTNIAYGSFGILFDGVFPAIALFFVYVASVASGYLSSERERRKVRDAFEHYISPSYMNQLAQNPDQLKLGGEEKNITTMFSDIRNFTSICEHLTPDEIISLMNEFLTPLSKAIMENRGTIDKYIGDAIMAFWNAPINDERHAYNACKAALDMQARLDALNKKRRAKDDDALVLAAGIGINTGHAAVGNMGSDQRFAYSVLGDSVNLASRLEAQTKQYGVGILLGENCLAEPDVAGLAWLELDLLRVKGRQQPTRIYTLLGDEKLAEEHLFTELKKEHERFLNFYRACNWDEARKQIKPCRYLAEKLELELDQLYACYRERIDSLRESSLPQDWDGVYIARTK